MGVKLPRLHLNANIPGAATWNDWMMRIVTTIERLTQPSTTGAISASWSPAGLHLHVPALPICFGVTTSTIAARSGSTAGTGTANLQLFNGTAFFADGAGSVMQVYNWSTGAGGVASGKNIVCVKIQGHWVVLNAEC